MSGNNTNTEITDGKYLLFMRQKEILEPFLAKGAIAQEQFDKILRGYEKENGLLIWGRECKCLV